MSTETIKDHQGTLTKWQITMIFNFIHIEDDDFINVIIHSSGVCPVIIRFGNVKPVGEFKGLVPLTTKNGPVPKIGHFLSLTEL